MNMYYPKPNLSLVHEAGRKLRCVFYSVVIKNESLARHYRGGIRAFFQKYPSSLCNEHLTVDCYMGLEFNETINDLIDNGLKFNEDFAFVDAGGYTIYMNNRGSHNVKLGGPWLNGRYSKGGIYVKYVGDES